MRRHYLWVASRLRQVEPVDCTRPMPHRVVVLASRSGKHLERALRFARLLHADRLETWHVRERDDRRLRVHWQERHADIPLTLLDTGRDGVAATLRRHLRRVKEQDPGTLITVVIAEQVGARRWQHVLAHRRGGAFSILWALRQESGVAVADVHYRPAGHQDRSRPRSDSVLTLVSKRLVRMAGTSLDFGRGLGGPHPPGGGDRPRLRGDRPHPAGTALRLHRMPRGGAGPARGDRTRTAGPGRSRLGPARAEDPPAGSRQPLPRPHCDRPPSSRPGRPPGRHETMLNVIIPEFVVSLDHRQAAPQPVRPVDPRRPLRRHPGRRHLRPLGHRRGQGPCRRRVTPLPRAPHRPPHPAGPGRRG